MTIEDRSSKIANLITDSHISPLEKLEMIERTYMQYAEAALLCLHAASVATDKADDEGQFSALADAADVLTYAMGDVDIVVTAEHQQLIREANKYADSIEDPDE